MVDVDPALVSYLGRALRRAPFPADVLLHDLRDPLGDQLHDSFDTVFTDPPYTAPGAELFLSRAVEAVLASPRADVFMAFGARRPEDTLRVQRSIAEMGFVTRRLIRNFNEYLGAGSLGGVSHLYHLSTTGELRPLISGRYGGHLYTGDFKEPVRRYRCRRCRRAHGVGRGQRWPTVEMLRSGGCPRCGGRTFTPLPHSGRQHAPNPR